MLKLRLAPTRASGAVIRKQGWMFVHVRTAMAVAMLAAGTLVAAPTPARSATTTPLVSFDNPGGGHIATGTFGHEPSLQAAAAAMLRAVHAQFGARPTVDQVAQNASGHAIALFFHTVRNGQPITGMSVVSATANGEASGAVLYDTTPNFPKSIDSMMKRLDANTIATGAGPSRGNAGPAVAQPLTEHPFADGTGTISVPANWTLKVAGGGSAVATGPAGEIVVYNGAQLAIDPTNQTARNYYHGMSPALAQTFLAKTVVLPYDGDPVHTFTTSFDQLAKRKGKAGPHLIAQHVTKLGDHVDEISGDGTGITYVAYVQLLPPDPMGQYTMASTYIVLPKGYAPGQAATAAAVLQSVHINFAQFAANGAAIRAMFAQQFNAMIARGQAFNVAMQERTDAFLANDREAQENMHREAVGMENFVGDRTTLVNTETGAHGTIGNGLADALVASDSKYQKVPPSRLLAGVDY